MTIQFAELKTLLQQDLADLEALQVLLQEERAALGQNDLAGVEAAVQQKHQLLDQVRNRAREKVRHLVAAGFKPADGAPSVYLESLGDSELTRLWQAAQQAMSQCQSANTVNGRVIDHLQKRMHRLSEIIRGVNPGQKLYGAAGREQAVSHKTVLANA